VAVGALTILTVWIGFNGGSFERSAPGKLQVSISSSESQAGGIQFPSITIPTTPRSLGSVESADHRFLYTLSTNEVVGILDIDGNRFIHGIDLNGRIIGSEGIALCKGKIYVGSSGNMSLSESIPPYSNVLVIDAATESIIRAIPQSFWATVGRSALATSPDCHFVYAVSGNSNEVFIIDTSLVANQNQNPVVGVIQSDPQHRPPGYEKIAVSPDGVRAYIIKSSGEFFVINLTSQQIISTSNYAGGGDTSLNVYPDLAVRSNGKVYVNWQDNYTTRISRLDRDGNLEQIFSFPFDPGLTLYGLAFSLDEQYIITGQGKVIRTDTNIIEGTYDIGTGPGSGGIGVTNVSLSGDGAKAFSTNLNAFYARIISGFTPSLTVSNDHPASGEAITLNVLVPNHPNQGFQIAASLTGGFESGLRLPENRILPLRRNNRDVNDLFNYSIRPGTRLGGTLDGNGRGSVTVTPSSFPGVTPGSTVYFDVVTYSGTRNASGVNFLGNLVPVVVGQ